ncbi:MAG: hypothetical protein ACPG81_05105 [Poseidonia sp.]
MGGGGTAPKMKMSDAFILTGLTLLLGGLFMHAWVSPVSLSASDPPFANGSSLMKGDGFNIEITVDNETTVRIVFMDEEGTVLSADSSVQAAGSSLKASFEASEGGYYSYEIDTKNTGASISVEIERKLMIDLLPFPVGALFLALGLYQRSATASTPEERPSHDDVLDAVLPD